MSNDLPVWNRETALKRLGNDEGFLREVLIMFVDSVEEMEKAIAMAVQARDVVQIKASVHSLKGVLANLSGEAATAKAAELEHLDPATVDAQADALHQQLLQEVAAFKVEAKSYLGQ